MFLNIKSDAKMMAKGGLEVFATDEPEITSHLPLLDGSHCNRITLDQQQAFDDLRFQNRFFF